MNYYNVILYLLCCFKLIFRNRSSGVVSSTKNDFSLNVSQSPPSAASSQVTTPNDEPPSPAPPQYNSVVTKPYSASSVSDTGSYDLENNDSVEKPPIDFDAQEELSEDPMIPNDLSEHKVISITHQDTIDSTDDKIDISLTVAAPSEMENHIEEEEVIVANSVEVVENAPSLDDINGQILEANADANVDAGASLGGGLMDELMSSSISSDLKLDLDLDTSLHITSTDAELENEVNGN